MSFGKMQSFIDIIETTIAKDSDGFAVSNDNIIASVRAYKEERHGTKIWANRASFSDATCLFRFRFIPDITVSTKNIIVCDNVRYKIFSAENIRDRDMYIECLCDRLEESKNG